ncbi:MAG: dockerin type I domain-containing protein, partial [Acutalibacteraceae bacterium]|nr:dockerin type I domain-containing protein [Acutalibacteraceae bacterium]
TNVWTTVTRYVQGVTDDLGTGSDTIHFFSEAGGGNLYIADVTITEVTADGGLNGDAVIDTTDYALMRSRFFSAKRDDSTMFEKYADQNSDGTVDVLDMVLLSKIGK